MGQEYTSTQLKSVALGLWPLITPPPSLYAASSQAEDPVAAASSCGLILCKAATLTLVGLTFSAAIAGIVLVKPSTVPTAMDVLVNTSSYGAQVWICGEA